jgi:uncharacterized protein YpmB
MRVFIEGRHVRPSKNLTVMHLLDDTFSLIGKDMSRIRGTKVLSINDDGCELSVTSTIYRSLIGINKKKDELTVFVVSKSLQNHKMDKLVYTQIK